MERDSPRAELRYREEGGDDGPTWLVVDEDLPLVVGRAGRCIVVGFGGYGHLVHVAGEVAVVPVIVEG